MGSFASSGRMYSQCFQVLQWNYITEHEDFPCEAAPSIFSASKIILLKTSTAVCKERAHHQEGRQDCPLTERITKKSLAVLPTTSADKRTSNAYSKSEEGKHSNFSFKGKCKPPSTAILSREGRHKLRQIHNRGNNCNHLALHGEPALSD